MIRKTKAATMSGVYCLEIDLVDIFDTLDTLDTSISAIMDKYGFDSTKVFSCGKSPTRDTYLVFQEEVDMNKAPVSFKLRVSMLDQMNTDLSKLMDYFKVSVGDSKFDITKPITFSYQQDLATTDIIYTLSQEARYLLGPLPTTPKPKASITEVLTYFERSQTDGQLDAWEYFKKAGEVD